MALERAARALVNAGIKTLDGIISGLISGAIGAFGPDKLKVFIEKGWHMIPSILYAAKQQPNYGEAGLSEEEAKRAEQMRRTLLSKIVLPALGMAKTIASRFPPEVIESKVTAKWIYEKLKAKHPEITKIIDEMGEKGWRWLEEEARTIVAFLTGKL